MKQQSIWVERFRPRTLADVIFQDARQESIFKSFVEAGEIPNLFLSGIQGTGKTTISKAILKDLNVHKADILRINCSDEKIDAIRSKVSSFAMTMPIGKFKVVQLEECDHLSHDAMALLRGLIEDTSANCRFIATCNYENRVIPPLKSRFQQFAFKAPDKEKVALRMASILDTENVQYNIEDLITYIEVGYPDVRKTIQLLQGNTVKGKLLAPTSSSAQESDWKFGLLDAVSAGDFKRARKIVCETASREEHEDIFTFMYRNVEKLKVKDKEEAILIIAEHLRNHSLVADTEINLAAMFIQLSRA
jgi:DNA polymerase III delta prime subunit